MIKWVQLFPERVYYIGFTHTHCPLAQLMEILATDELGDVVSWLPHGKGFLIYKKKKFATETLPKYFKQSKFTSFTRKLNRWGFTRVTRGPETGAYYHKMFQKGDHRRCMQMSCQTTIKQIPSITCNHKVVSTVSNSFLPQALSDADLAEQNQNIIRHQLQQLQLQQSKNFICCPLLTL